MEIMILIGCAAIGVAAYFGVVKPLILFFVPLTKRIPTGKEYRPTIGARS